MRRPDRLRFAARGRNPSSQPLAAELLSTLLILLWVGLPAYSQTLDEARALHRAGKLKEALAAYEAVAAASLPQDPESAAVAHNNRCVILSLGLADQRAALAECETALELRRRLGDERRLGRTLNNLGLVLHYLGRWGEARKRFEEALGINRRLGESEAQAINLANLGLLAIAAGNYEAALLRLREAEDLARKHPDEPWAAEQLRVARLNHGVVFEKLGAYREALALYRQVMAEKAEMDAERQATLAVNMGVLYRNLGDPVTAIEAFEEAAEIYRRRGDDSGLSNALLNRALALHLNLDDPVSAEADYRRALALASASGDRPEEIQDLFYLGNLLLEGGRVAEAEQAFHRSLAIAEDSGSAEGTWCALEGLAKVAAARGDLAGSLVRFRRAMAEIERVRSGLREPARRAGYFGDKRRIYAGAVGVLADLERAHPGGGWAEEALEVVQRAKARELLEALGSANAASKPLPAVELRRLAGTVAPGVVARGRSMELPILELFVGSHELYSWVIRKEGVKMIDLGPASPVLAAAEKVRRALAAGRQPPEEAVSRLSRLLLARTGVAGGNPPVLRIAPDGRLRYLPFEILRDPANRGRPLVDRLPVIYLPSASTLGRLSQADPRPPEATLSLLGLGDPQLPAEGEAGGSPAAWLAARFHLRPLPAAAEELRRVARHLSGLVTLRTGAEATEAAFRQAVEAAPRVIHLAAHTVLDERLGQPSGREAAVVLAPSGDDDGLLFPVEIATLDLRTRLTVLATCSSALGDGEDGHALTSLSGAFLAAGSKGLVATLWDVDDAVTAAFMDQLYFFLGRGISPPLAMQQAKRRFRSDPRWRRTDLWSAYVLIGEPPPVTSPPGLGFWSWATLAALAMAAFTLLVLRPRPESPPHSPPSPQA